MLSPYMVLGGLHEILDGSSIVEGVLVHMCYVRIHRDTYS